MCLCLCSDQGRGDRDGRGEEASLGDAEEHAQEGEPPARAAAADRGRPQDHLDAQRRRREALREGQDVQEADGRDGTQTLTLSPIH